MMKDYFILKIKMHDEFVIMSGIFEVTNDATKVSAVIKNNKLTSIDILLSFNEDTSYFNKAINIVDSIIEKQLLDVRKISKDTMSSNGVLKIVANML